MPRTDFEILGAGQVRIMRERQPDVTISQLTDQVVVRNDETGDVVATHPNWDQAIKAYLGGP